MQSLEDLPDIARQLKAFSHDLQHIGNDVSYFQKPKPLKEILCSTMSMISRKKHAKSEVGGIRT